MKDYVKILDSVACGKMIIKNRSAVNGKLEKLIEAGLNKIQVLSDFDGTITKQHINDKTQKHGYLILYGLSSFPPELPRRALEISREYSKYQNDPDLEKSEKFKRMEELWTKTVEVFNGYIITKGELDKHCKDLGLQLRDNTKEFFDILKKEEIPILLVSAGIGDVIESMIRNEGITGSSIEIASNFLNLDQECRLNGLKATPIHKLNKIDCVKYTNFYENLKQKNNVIVIGDQLGDAVVVEKLDNVDTVLKIGFFYGQDESKLPTWLDTFDIVLNDDQSMNVPIAILKFFEK